jgi:hypothetical protein
MDQKIQIVGDQFTPWCRCNSWGSAGPYPVKYSPIHTTIPEIRNKLENIDTLIAGEQVPCGLQILYYTTSTSQPRNMWTVDNATRRVDLREGTQPPPCHSPCARLCNMERDCPTPPLTPHPVSYVAVKYQTFSQTISFAPDFNVVN